MYFKQYYLGCLAHASYLIGSGGDAVVVDPQRDVTQYIDEAAAQGLRIGHIIETHLHADFVSGHQELARRTGAKIYFGAAAQAAFDHVAVRDGQEIRVGDIVFRFLETPGHTPESISILIIDTTQSPEPQAILTGDTLFIGDVGRPDLLGARMPASELAGMLYDSLHKKILALPDSVRVYPAHGAGSMCGRNISKETTSTIGEQRKFNYALQPMDREEFIRMMTTDLPEAPAYFSQDARINREGATGLDELPAPQPLTAEAVKQMKEEGRLVLDTRPPDQYLTSHIPGSLHIGLGGQFASWAGTLIPLSAPVILIAEDSERVNEARLRLARVGIEHVVGYLEGGILSWHQSGFPMVSVEQISVDELNRRLQEGQPGQLIDVRRPGEWATGHIGPARNLPLHQLKDALGSMDAGAHITAICAGGYRSTIACSLLEQNGFRHITNVVGGMSAWASAKLQVLQ